MKDEIRRLEVGKLPRKNLQQVQLAADNDLINNALENKAIKHYVTLN